VLRRCLRWIAIGPLPPCVLAKGQRSHGCPERRETVDELDPNCEVAFSARDTPNGAAHRKSLRNVGQPVQAVAQKGGNDMSRKPDWILVLAVAVMLAPYVLAVALIIRHAF